MYVVQLKLLTSSICCAWFTNSDPESCLMRVAAHPESKQPMSTPAMRVEVCVASVFIFHLPEENVMISILLKARLSANMLDQFVLSILFVSSHHGFQGGFPASSF